MMTSRSKLRAGVTMGVLAYGIWGLLPLYLHQLGSIGPWEILAQRILWSLLFILALTATQRGWGRLGAVLARPRLIAILLLSALLIAANWLIYIIAIATHQTLQASLGYFINPLVIVALGVVFLRERLARIELAAVGLAAIGVAIIAVAQGGVPLIAIGLALSFGLYGLVRKMAPVDPLEGLTIETALLAPAALGWLLWRDRLWALPAGAPPYWVLMLVGPITVAALLLFAGAAKRLRFSEIGLLQYISPTLQLLCAIGFGERISAMQLIAFAFIWAGLFLYAGATFHRGRVPRPVPLD